MFEFFAIHAMRNRQPMQWLFVLFAFPLLGSLVILTYVPSIGLWLPRTMAYR